MIYVELPPAIAASQQRLPFYLSMEEHLARNYGGEYFVMWQVLPTVIYGRNQDVRAEVNIPFCIDNNIQFYRRKSGGGCVYADRNNIMTALISSSTEVEATFAEYCHRLAATLRELGLDAEANGRNDIVIGSRKVSGNAFHHLPGRSIVHGTMLYDTDPATMQKALTPSTEKLAAKGVSSVRSHITTIREHLPQLGIEEFKDFLRSRLSDSTMTLTDDDVAEIRRIEAPYYDPAWLYGTTSAQRRHGRVRIEGCGEFSPEIITDADGIIKSVKLTGDFFPLADIDSGLLRHLRGVALTPEALADALSGIDAGETISGLSNEQLITLLISDNHGRD